MLPLLVAHHSNVEIAFVGHLEVELQAAQDRTPSRSEGGVVGVEVRTDNELDVGQRPGRERFRIEDLVPTERAAEETLDLRVSGATR